MFTKRILKYRFSAKIMFYNKSFRVTVTDSYHNMTVVSYDEDRPILTSVTLHQFPNFPNFFVDTIGIDNIVLSDVVLYWSRSIFSKKIPTIKLLLLNFNLVGMVTESE